MILCSSKMPTQRLLFLLGQAQFFLRGVYYILLLVVHCDPVSCYKGLGCGRVASYLDKFFNGECFAIFVLLALFDGQAQGQPLFSQGENDVIQDMREKKSRKREESHSIKEVSLIAI